MRITSLLAWTLACSDGGATDAEPTDGVTTSTTDLVATTDSVTTTDTDTTPPEDTGPFDSDDDGVNDAADNCFDKGNPGQEDLDVDGIGDACDDSDGDTVPDGFDPWPTDVARPGVAAVDFIYAHSSSTLYVVTSDGSSVTKVGAFSGTDGEVTDIAIDRYGVLYAVSFIGLYVCHPQTAQCWPLAALPDKSFNGLTFVTQGTLDPWQDVLVGLTEVGGWYRLDRTGETATATLLGEVGNNWKVAGDAFALDGAKTYAALYQEGISGTSVLEVDPLTGAASPYTFAGLNNWDRVYGLAGLDGNVLAFDESGDIIVMDGTGQQTAILKNNVKWWGAGVRTNASAGGAP